MKNKLTYNKTQLELISYFIDLSLEDITNPRIKKEAINILIKNQKNGIWGNLPQNTFDEINDQ
jgi:hypothetical protein